jgi:2-polyprenyl-3-methyl-5-hydroxy-6-metoxy-1,4-benzoquinol methylase
VTDYTIYGDRPEKASTEPGIDLADRRSARDHRWHRLVAREDLSGQSVLDIGSRHGELCLDALRRGAASATGLDASSARVRTARRRAGHLGLPAKYLEADFEAWDPPGTYDVVLCRSLLDRFYDPIGALRKIMAIARRRILLEVGTFQWGHLRRWRNWPALLCLPVAPVALLDRPRRSHSAASRVFTFSRQALSIIFNEHTKAFEALQFHSMPWSGRLLVEARRRSIRHLVVVAGPSSVGKSTVLQRLEHSEPLRHKFGIDGSPPLFLDASDVDSLPAGPLDTVVYHYDLLRPFRRSVRTHARDPAFHLLSSADRVTLITLANRPEVLGQRIVDTELSRSWFREKARHRDLQRRYQSPGFLLEWYDAWLTATAPYLEDQGSSYLVVTDDDYPVLADRQALRRLLVGGH